MGKYLKFTTGFLGLIMTAECMLAGLPTFAETGQAEVETANVEVWDLQNYTEAELAEYDECFVVDRERAAKPATTCGSYSSSTPDKCYDGKSNTHWESTTQTTDDKKNYIEFTFPNTETIGRIIYQARTDNNGNGFATKFEIYGSDTDAGEYKLMVKGEYPTASKNKMEISFSEHTFKKLKFVWISHTYTYPSAAEFRFYKTDTSKAALKALFKDAACSELKDGIEKADVDAAWNTATENYPKFLTEALAVYRDKAYGLLGEEPPKLAPDAKVELWDLRSYTDDNLAPYNELYLADKERSASVTNNGGAYGGHVAQYCYDGDWNKHWETNTPNSDTFKNHIDFQFKQTETIGRIIFRARVDSPGRGFPEEFKIYGSDSDNKPLELVACGSYPTVTTEALEISFPERQFKRLRFVFVKAQSGYAAASEIRFYREDSVKKRLSELFTDDTMSELRSGVDKAAVDAAWKEATETYPSFLHEFIAKYRNRAYELLDLTAPSIAETAEVEAWELMDYADGELTAYNKKYGVDTERKAKVTNNGGSYDGGSKIENCYDGDWDSHWETRNPNNDSGFKNHIDFEFEKPETIGRIIFRARKGRAGKGIPE